MERAEVVKAEIIDQNKRFLAVYVEARNSCLVLLSEREDKLGTLAIAVPRLKDLIGPPSSSILLGDRNMTSARTFAEDLATTKGKIALVSIYLESMDERQAQSAFKKLLGRVINKQPHREGVTA